MVSYIPLRLVRIERLVLIGKWLAQMNDNTTWHKTYCTGMIDYRRYRGQGDVLRAASVPFDSKRYMS